MHEKWMSYINSLYIYISKIYFQCPEGQRHQLPLNLKPHIWHVQIAHGPFIKWLYPHLDFYVSDESRILNFYLLQWKSSLSRKLDYFSYFFIFIFWWGKHAPNNIIMHYKKKIKIISSLLENPVAAQMHCNSKFSVRNS